jgi:O-antigen/teichoic acid export membrane protein
MKITQLLWTFFGLLVPLLFAALFIPRLLEQIGDERFGILAIAWGLLGFSGLLDLGIGRATTKLTADAIGRRDFDSIPSILQTAIRLSFVMSTYGAVLLCAVLAIGAAAFLKTETVSRFELVSAAFVLSLALPFQAMSSTYKGINEAFLNLKAVSVIRMGLGASTFALPFAIAFVSKRVDLLVSSILLSRILAFVLYRMFSLRCVDKSSPKKPEYSKDIQANLLKFGGWFTVSCILNPIVLNMDRLLLGSMISTAAVAVYAIPYEFCTQSLIAVGTVTTIAFPHLSKAVAINDALAWKKFHLILILSLLMMIVIAFALYCTGSSILSIWLGSDVSPDSIRVMQILALGLVPYTLGTVSISFLHACSRTDVCAKIHLAELVIFVPLTVFLIQHESTIGAAKAWVSRVAIDAAFLYIASHIVFSKLRHVRSPNTTLEAYDAII